MTTKAPTPFQMIGGSVRRFGRIISNARRNPPEIIKKVLEPVVKEKVMAIKKDIKAREEGENNGSMK